MDEIFFWRARRSGMRVTGVVSDELVSTRIQIVTPEFDRELEELGDTKLSGDDLVSMRIHNVTTEFVR